MLKIPYSTERINNFCDAVFAIAMTLLILEIKIPSQDDMTTLGTVGSLVRIIPNFVGFLISFLVTALYWRAHLALARYIHTYTDQLLWQTVWLLLFVVLLPFSTALYSRYFGMDGPFVFYCLNLVAIGLANYRMVVTVKHAGGFHADESVYRYLRFRALSASAVWALSAVWVFVEPYSARGLFILIFIVQAVYQRRVGRKGK